MNGLVLGLKTIFDNDLDHWFLTWGPWRESKGSVNVKFSTPLLQEFMGLSVVLIDTLGVHWIFLTFRGPRINQKVWTPDLDGPKEIGPLKSKQRKNLVQN